MIAIQIQHTDDKSTNSPSVDTAPLIYKAPDDDTLLLFISDDTAVVLSGQDGALINGAVVGGLDRDDYELVHDVMCLKNI